MLCAPLPLKSKVCHIFLRPAWSAHKLLIFASKSSKSFSQATDVQIALALNPFCVASAGSLKHFCLT
eukprot:993524-Amphidinium_carterae.1